MNNKVDVEIAMVALLIGITVVILNTGLGFVLTLQSN
jgi:hypothetical protein